MKLCECGCGEPAPIADKTTRAKGYVAGEPRRFIAGHYRPARATKTYPMKSAPAHPRAKRHGRRRGCVAEHVLEAECALGRHLSDGAEVHHVDGDRTNNAHRNLVICQDRAYHKLLHSRARVVQAGGDPNTQQICGACRRALLFDAFNRATQNKSTGLQRRCRECSRRKAA